MVARPRCLNDREGWQRLARRGSRRRPSPAMSRLSCDVGTGRVRRDRDEEFGSVLARRSSVAKRTRLFTFRMQSPGIGFPSIRRSCAPPLGVVAPRQAGVSRLRMARKAPIMGVRLLMLVYEVMFADPLAAWLRHPAAGSGSIHFLLRPEPRWVRAFRSRSSPP